MSVIYVIFVECKQIILNLRKHPQIFVLCYYQQKNAPDVNLIHEL